MSRAPHIRLVGSLEEVTENDVDAVRAGFAGEFAKVRPFLRGGRLGAVRELARDVVSLFELLTDRTFSIPWRTTAAVVFALAYVLSSFDAIPDVIPVLGFADDALVVAEVIYLISGDLRRFRAHQANRAATAVAPAAPASHDDLEAPPESTRLPRVA